MDGHPPTQKDPQERLDEAFLRRVVMRDPQALELFFELYFDRVYDYLRRLFRDPIDADDAVQETFLRLSRKVDQMDPSREPSGWVFRIATNVSHDHWRTRKRGARGLENSFDESWSTAPPTEEENALERLEREEREALIHVAMGQLSPADREIILLKSYEELATEEIADTLEISTEAVRQRHSRAVRRLGKIYGELTREERLSS